MHRSALILKRKLTSSDGTHHKIPNCLILKTFNNNLLFVNWWGYRVNEALRFGVSLAADSPFTPHAITIAIAYPILAVKAYTNQQYIYWTYAWIHAH